MRQANVQQEVEWKGLDSSDPTSKTLLMREEGYHTVKIRAVVNNKPAIRRGVVYVGSTDLAERAPDVFANELQQCRRSMQYASELRVDRKIKVNARSSSIRRLVEQENNCSPDDGLTGVLAAHLLLGEV